MPDLESSLTPERVAQSLKSHFVIGGPSQVHVRTHYGNAPLLVREIWEHNGALHISVTIPESFNPSHV